MSALDIALGYLHRGWAPVPIAPREKGPKLKGWQKLRITAKDASRYFDGADQNIGVILGAASGYLADADLDCAEAVGLAPSYLPPTEALFGRAGKPRSHWLYKSAVERTLELIDPEDGEMLVELRTNGAQTVFPGSTHKETGEEIDWVEDGDPALVDPDRLVKAVKQLAAACILLRHNPQKERHYFFRAVSGWLLRNDWEPEEVKHFLLPVARMHLKDRERQAEEEIRRLVEPVTDKLPGFKTLVEHLGEKRARKLGEWLGVERKEAPKARDQADPEEGEGDGRAVIHLAEAKVNAHARQCADLLKGEVFLRGPNASVLVRVEEIGRQDDGEYVIGGVRRQKGALMFEPPTPARIQYRLDEKALFKKYDSRKRAWRNKACPPALAERIIAAAPEVGFRQCAGIVAVPLFIKGQVIATNGYHAGHKVYLDLACNLPPIPDKPTEKEVEAALETLLKPFRGYIDGKDEEAKKRLRRAFAAAVLTALLRPSLGAAPAILLDGNVPGAGKGKAGRALAIINAGRHPAAITEGFNDEETEKRIASAVLGGSPAILLDNLQRTLATSALESGLTEAVATIRLFGKLTEITVPFMALVIITANNATLRADMLRRTLPVRIVADTEEPELTRFDFDPVEEAAANRSAIIAAGMTIARAWWQARETEEGRRVRQKTLGSFEQWADLVAGAVEWLTGLNPIALIEERKKQDPKKVRLAETGENPR